MACVAAVRAVARELSDLDAALRLIRECNLLLADSPDSALVWTDEDRAEFAAERRAKYGTFGQHFWKIPKALWPQFPDSSLPFINGNTAEERANLQGRLGLAKAAAGIVEEPGR
jgi:hypothetical protein